MLGSWKKIKTIKTIKTSQIIVDDIDVQIVRKKIKNMHLRVYPPDGRVRVAVPMHICDDGVRRTILDRLTWIRKQQVRLANMPAPTPREIISGECHYYLGDPYLLDVIERRGKHEAAITNNAELLLYVRPGVGVDKRASVLNEWYRLQIKAILPDLIQKWEPIIGVKVGEWGVKKMKTRWGTCNITSSRIWLNLELIKKPKLCLEYVLVHEMVHLLERYHNKNFKAYMDKFMPEWRLQDELLKREPLARDL